MRSPVDTITAPPFPRDLPWVNVATLRMDQQLGRPVLVEFWDFCRPNSLHTLPYLRAWQHRYAEQGLRVIGVHASGFEPSAGEPAVRAAVERLGIEYPVALDLDFQVWREYGNRGWPARFLWDQQGRLHEFHYGEGAYDETERAIQELLGIDRELVAPARPEDHPNARLAAPTAEQPGLYRGPYAAGAAWAVLDGRGVITMAAGPLEVEHPGAHCLVRHPRHTEAVLDLEVGDGVRCHAVCFTAGLV